MDRLEAREDQKDLLAFFRSLTALFHLYPVLRRSRFFTGETNPDIDVKDVTWIDANGFEMTRKPGTMASRKSFGMLLDGRAQVTGLKRPGGGRDRVRHIQRPSRVVEFTLPETPESAGWNRLMDTNDPDLPAQAFEFGKVYEVTGRGWCSSRGSRKRPKARSRSASDSAASASHAASPLQTATVAGGHR